MAERPSIPSKTLAATMAAAKQQQLLQMQQHQQGPEQGRGSGVPSFVINKNDMGKNIILLSILK
jgi:hypothetical protein